MLARSILVPVIAGGVWASAAAAQMPPVVDPNNL